MFKKLVALCLVGMLFIVSGCAKGTGIGGTTIGDGKIDLIEASVIKLSIMNALSTKPELAEPAYQVSLAILVNLNSTDQLVMPEHVDQILTEEIEKLHLSMETKQAVILLASMIKNSLIQYLNNTPNTSNKLVLIKQVVQMVNVISASQVKKPAYNNFG